MQAHNAQPYQFEGRAAIRRLTGGTPCGQAATDLETVDYRGLKQRFVTGVSNQRDISCRQNELYASPPTIAVTFSRISIDRRRKTQSLV